MFFFSLCLSIYISNGLSISGYIENKEGVGLKFSTIKINNKTYISDSVGFFSISDIKENTKSITVSYVGYKTKIVEINTREENHLKIILENKTNSLGNFTVVDNSIHDHSLKNSHSIEAISNIFLEKNRASSFVESIEKIPGVNSIDIGSGQSKPIIRGLAFNRISIVENGIKHQGQQWGADHGLEIDQYNVSKIEIIKGTNSLRYGSGSLGGIIKIDPKSIPNKDFLFMGLDLAFMSNNLYRSASTNFNIKRKKIFFDVRVSLIGFSDLLLPSSKISVYSYNVELYKNRLRNTAGKEYDLYSTIAYKNKKFTSKLMFSSVNAQSGFFANTHGLEPRQIDNSFYDKNRSDIDKPFQKSNHYKVINNNTLFIKGFEIDTKIGYQKNLREEKSNYVNHGYMPDIFPDTLSFDSDLERKFDKDIFTGMLFTKKSIGNHKLEAGVNYEQQNNKIGGRGFIIPDFKQVSFGSYIISNLSFNKHLFNLGIRYDFSNIETESYLDWFKSPVNSSKTVFENLKRSESLDKHFQNISFSVGYVLSKNNSVYKINFGKGFRTPSAKELSANGVNYHQFSYEKGNKNLEPENSYELDISYILKSNLLNIEISGFYNYFTNYIYLNPTSRIDRLYGNGNQVFEYKQAEVTRIGAEFSANYHINSFLDFLLIAEYLFAKQNSGDKKGFSLPFSPPPNIKPSIVFYLKNNSFFENTNFSLNYIYSFEQSRIVPPEEVTSDYHVINFGFGSDIIIKNKRYEVNISINNLLNNKYFKHTSFYRLINVPQPARSININLKIPIIL